MHSRTRVLFVAHTAGLGGPSNSLLLLLKHLRTRYRTSVLLPESGPLCDRIEEGGVPYHVIPKLDWRTIPKIRRLIKTGEFDVVYGNNPSGRSRNALIAAKLSGLPFVWHFRGMKQHWGRRQGVFVKWADEVVAVSRACAAPLEKYRGSRGVRVIYNGVELGRPPSPSAAGRRQLSASLGLQKGSRYLLSVSHLLPRKGHERALEVLRRITAQRPHVHLLLAGAVDRNKPYVQDFQRLIHERGLSERVHILGFRTDVPELLAACDVVIHTAERDPHPRSVIEAMAASAPVVAFSVDGVAETIVDGESGTLVDYGDEAAMTDAVIALLDSPKTAETMGRNGRKRVEREFTAEATARDVAQVIDRLAGRLPGKEVSYAMEGLQQR